MSAERLREAADRLDVTTLLLVTESEDTREYAKAGDDLRKALVAWLRAEAESQAFYENLTRRPGNYTVTDEAFAVVDAILGGET